MKDDSETIAFELSVQEKRVEEIMHYLVEVGLFESSQGIVTCLKLAERLDKSMTNSPKMRSWLDNKSVMTCADEVMTDADDVKTCAELDKIRLEENRKEKSNDNAPLVLQSFEFFWQCWADCKKSLQVKNSSPKKPTLDKFKKMFNNAYFAKNTEQEFRDEINLMCSYAKSNHAEAEFIPFKNMQTGKFLTNQGWK